MSQPKCPATPVCDEWANGIRAQFELLREFGEWFSRTVIEETPDGANWINWPIPERRWFERFLKEEKGFDWDELERERRALLDYQRSLNEKKG